MSDYIVGSFQVGLFFCPFGRVWHPCVGPLHSIMWSVHTRVLLTGRKHMSSRDQCGTMYNTLQLIHVHIYIYIYIKLKNKLCFVV